MSALPEPKRSKMLFEEITPTLEQLGILFKYDEIMKLWLVFLDDVTVYGAPKEIESLSVNEFKYYFAQQIQQYAPQNLMEKEAVYH